VSGTELARREARAQHGIIEFAEELQAIRDGNLYPGALKDGEPWATYCKERWGMSKSIVDQTIRALPVLQRMNTRAVGVRIPVGSAAAVATLPESVQDEILDNTEKRDEVKEKAKAVRRAAKKIEAEEGRAPTDDELIVAAATVKPKPKKRKPKMKASRFVSNLAQGHWHLEQAADIAHNEPIDDVENDYGWAMIAKYEYEVERLREKLYQPEIVKDADEDFAALLGGEGQ
jgi:hypothetical protein